MVEAKEDVVVAAGYAISRGSRAKPKRGVYRVSEKMVK